MSESRQLAAIMFTDIVGYSAIIAKDESRALELLNKNRAIQRPLIKKYRGKWLKEMGDGVLASFSTASDAVYCAGEIQRVCNLDPDLNLRVGIHLGEVLFKDEDVFGAGVNVASRLEAISPIGGILISEAVHSNVVNRRGISSKYVGQKSLKNIEDPVKVYSIEIDKEFADETNNLVFNSNQNSRKQTTFRYMAISIFSLIAIIATFVFFKTNQTEKSNVLFEESIEHSSIAVLPFVNMSSDPEQEYFSDGICEEIINRLAKTPGLKVTARTSAFQFRGGKHDIKMIGAKLGVSTILEGSVRKSGNRVRVTAQLISVQDGFNIWSQTYDRDMTDIFAIQEELSNSITDALRLEIATAARGSLNETSNLVAYNYYLQGRYFWNKRNEEGILKSIEFFEKALNEDPNYAMAYVGMADAYNMMAIWNLIQNKEGFQLARNAALNALKLDNQLGPAYAALAYLQMSYDWNWEASRENFLKAQQLSPSYAPAFYWYSELCSTVGDSEEAVLNMEKAIQLDPLSLIINSELAWLYMFDHGEPELAMEQVEKTLEMDPEFVPGHFYFYHIYYHLGKMDRSFKHFKQYHRWFPDSSRLNNRYEQSGWEGVAQAMLEAIESGVGPSLISPVTMAEYYCHLKEYDTSLDFIEQAYLEKDHYLTHVAAWPFFKPLHKEYRFQQVMSNMNLDLSRLGPHL